VTDGPSPKQPAPEGASPDQPAADAAKGAEIESQAADEPRAKIEVPLYEQEAYDQITLDEINESKVLKVLPIDFPDRRVPDPFPRGGKLEVRLLDEPESTYEILWSSIERIELFHDLVLKKANELVGDGRLEEAYDYFQHLLDADPELPGLKAAIDNYLYEEAKASQRKARYDEALAMLRELHGRDPEWPGLENALGVVTEKLVERYVEADNYWAARQMVRNLADLCPDHAVVAKWEADFQAEASALLTEGREAEQAGRLRQAHAAGRRLMHVWPDLPGGREFIDSIQRQYPRLVVGVTMPAVDCKPGRLHDRASRRSNRLLYRTLMEFVGRGTEGGEYDCPFGEMEVQELGLRLAFRIDAGLCRSVGAPDLTGYDLARRLVAMADPRDPAYRGDWAGLVERVSAVRDVYRVNVELRRPHVRPEALLRSVVFARGGSPDAAATDVARSGDRPQLAVGGSPASREGAAGDNSAERPANHSPLAVGHSPVAPSAGPYRVESRAQDEVVYVASPEYALGAGQPKEIVERFCRKGSEAIKLLERGVIHVLDRVNPWDLDKVEAIDGVVVEPYSMPAVHCLVPNLNRPFPARRVFRRALVYGIYREKILKHLLRDQPLGGCQVVSGPFSPGISPDDPLDYGYDHALEPRGYDPHLALALAQVALSEVAEALEKEGIEVADIPEIVLAHPAHEIARVACTSIQRQLKLVGIPVVLRELSAGMPAQVPDDVDLLYVELTVCEPVVDAGRLLGEGGISGGPSIFMAQALRQLDQATDWKEVPRRLRHIHRLSQKEVTIVPLWQLTDYFAYQRSLKGVGTEPVSLYQNVEQWEPSIRYAAEEK
jgi:tetratricopeptide (TPR) repeat protein